jgi:hypothetical protein
MKAIEPSAAVAQNRGVRDLVALHVSSGESPSS